MWIRSIWRSRLRGGWVGPHFSSDLIRYARKGWPTLLRVAFLVIVLLSLMLMERSAGHSGQTVAPAEFARRADNYAWMLIVLQYLLVLAILPAYVATAIVEERENQTLESLTLTHLTDRELVLGKLLGRLAHVGVLTLANLPLLAFMHLWGNVDLEMLFYHEAHLLLLLLSAGSICICISSFSDSSFQATSSAYGAMAAIAVATLCLGFAMPGASGSRDGNLHYVWALCWLAPSHLLTACFFVAVTIGRMELLRRDERRTPRKLTSALTLTDGRPVSTHVGKRGQVNSRIHPLAFPIGSNALFWKECLKDGTDYSLTARWILGGVALVLVISLGCHFLNEPEPPQKTAGLGRAIGGTLGLTTYFLSLAVYTIVVLFQMTFTVASEREQGTLAFLLMIPETRAKILFAKWLGPWWRNWPILAIAYFGVLIGFGSGTYSWIGMLYLFLVPWPMFLLCGSMALWLSVVCRRVLFANLIFVGLLSILIGAYVVAGELIMVVLSYGLYLLGVPEALSSLRIGHGSALLITMAYHGLLLGAAAAFWTAAFRTFGNRDYGSN